MDNVTSLVSKGKFARVCIEIDISKPLLSKFTLDWKLWPIVYEGIHLVCFNCGLYGYRQDQCVKGGSDGVHTSEGTANNDQEREIHPRVAPSIAPQTHLPVQHFKDNFGPWMLVTWKDRRGQGRGNNRPTSGRQLAGNNTITPRFPTVGLESQSHFAVLDGLDRDEHAPIHEVVDRVLDVCNASKALPQIKTNYRQAQKDVVQQNK